MEVVDELQLLFLGLEGVDGVEPGSGFCIYLEEVVGQHGHVVLGLVFILLFFLGIGIVVSVHLTAALSEERFHLLQVSAPVARPAVDQSVIYLDVAVTLSAFRAGNADVELSSRHQLYGFLADVLQLVQEGFEGWSIISRDDAAQHFLVSLEEQLLFIREIFLDFIEVGSIVTWLLILVLILLVFFHVFRIFMLLFYC